MASDRVRLRGVARARGGDLAFADVIAKVDGASAASGQARGGFDLELEDGTRVDLDVTAARAVPEQTLRGPYRSIERDPMARAVTEVRPAPDVEVAITGVVVSDGDVVEVDGRVTARALVGGGPREPATERVSAVAVERLGIGDGALDREDEVARRKADAEAEAVARARRRRAIGQRVAAALVALFDGGPTVLMLVGALCLIGVALEPTTAGVLATVDTAATWIGMGLAWAIYRSPIGQPAKGKEQDGTTTGVATLVICAVLMGGIAWIATLVGRNALQIVWFGWSLMLGVIALLLWVRGRDRVRVMKTVLAAPALPDDAPDGTWGSRVEHPPAARVPESDAVGAGRRWLVAGRIKGGRFEASGPRSIFAYRTRADDPRRELARLWWRRRILLVLAIALPIVIGLLALVLADRMPALVWPEGDGGAV